MISLCNVTKTFRKDFWSPSFTALDNVSFTIGEGEAIGFLGANGAGKTTALKILFDFIKPNSGKVEFSGTAGKNLSEALGRIGYLPERPYFYPHLTGAEFVHYMGELTDVSKSDRVQRMQYWAERFKIDHALGRMIRGYSKGMLQRIGFVSILVHNPDILILDEPLSGLDPIGRKELKDVLREIAKLGKTVFFSSHIVSDIEEVCKKVVVLEKGALLYEGDIESLLSEHDSKVYELKIRTFAEKLKLENEVFYEKLYDLHIHRIDGFVSENVARVLSSGAEIYSLNPLRPSLEQIIYKIRP